MLDFINNNGVLFSGLFSVLTALITAIIAVIVENKKCKSDTIKSLKSELEQIKNEYEKYVSIEQQEKNIDKSTGAIYIETLPNGEKRNICGYCWEKNKIKIPLIMDSYYSDERRENVIYGECACCKATCYEE